MLTVTCCRCLTAKPTTEFHRDPKKRNGLQSACKRCIYTARQAKGRTDYNPSRARELWLKSKYGLSADQFDAILERQNGLCAVCSTDGPLSVDHDHNTGKIRGLLCRHCNLAEGHLRGDSTRMRALADYIDRTGE